MNRPDNLMAYDELDLKLGIKSSLPHVKGTLALSVLLWECADHPSELVFSEQKDKETVLTQELRQWLSDYLSEICEEENIDIQKVISCANDNQLFKSQMEALIVAFELVWKLAKVSFVDSSKAASAERTGGIRYPKKLAYSVNMDIIHSVISSNESAFVRVLLSWIGVDVTFDPECELILLKLLTALAEGAVFKLVDGEKDVIFNQNSIYRKLLETNQPVDVNGDKEAKGSLRILKSLLSDSMNPYLKYSGGSVSAQSVISDRLDDYQKRVETLLRLNATKVIGLDSLDADQEGASFDDLEKTRISTGTNVLLYGVPGSGKSWTIEHEYCKKGTHVERLVFHPDYTYSDFIGQILPVVAEDGQVSYQFTAGPFTNILKDAYLNPTEEYILVIEEINRGNAPAIFGEVFQLLDRKVIASEKYDDGMPIGTSEYGITNANIAKIVYGDSKHKVKIPSNLSIIGTMNTSDQNVFTLDTAFQRRWEMRLIGTSGTFNLNALPCKVIKPFAVYLHRRIHRRCLHYIALHSLYRIGNFRKRNRLFALCQHLAPYVLGIGSHTEPEGRTVSLVADRIQVGCLCRSADIYRQNACRHRVERTAVTDFSRSCRPSHYRHNIKRGEILRLIDTDHAVYFIHLLSAPFQIQAAALLSQTLYCPLWYSLRLWRDRRRRTGRTRFLRLSALPF